MSVCSKSVLSIIILQVNSINNKRSFSVFVDLVLSLVYILKKPFDSDNCKKYINRNLIYSEVGRPEGGALMPYVVRKAQGKTGITLPNLLFLYIKEFPLFC